MTVIPVLQPPDGVQKLFNPRPFIRAAATVSLSPSFTNKITLVPGVEDIVIRIFKSRPHCPPIVGGSYLLATLKPPTLHELWKLRILQ